MNFVRSGMTSRIGVQLVVCALLACFLSAPAVAQMTVEKSVERLVLQQEIVGVISQYSFMWDGKNAAGLAALFTEDGVWERWSPGAEKATPEIKGKDKFRDWTAERFNTTLADRQTRHYQTNTVFTEIRDDVVRTRTIFVIMQVLAADKSLKVVTTGTYEDEFQRTPAGWKISRRILRSDNN